MIERFVDYVTLKYQWVYSFRRKWCKSLHRWKWKKGEGIGYSECNRCGFWEEFS